MFSTRPHLNLDDLSEKCANCPALRDGTELQFKLIAPREVLYAFGTGRQLAAYGTVRGRWGGTQANGVNSFKNLQQPDHKTLCFREHKSWLRRHI